MQDMQSRIALGVWGAVWSLLATLAVMRWFELGALPVAVAVSVLPGLSLFVYVVARPTSLRVVFRLVSSLMGLVALVVSLRYMASDGCQSDPLCGSAIMGPPIVDLGLFGTLVAVQMTLARNRGRNSPGSV